MFAILDTAEEQGCDEIIMPVPARGWAGVFSCRITGEVMRGQRDVPVVTVDGDGVAAPDSQARCSAGP